MNPGIACTSSTISTDQHGTAALALAPDFPTGLQILLVEENLVCLTVIFKMLRKCLYYVTTCKTVNKALELILKKPGWFDLVLSDVYMADTNSFKLLQCIGMDIPVIMMSSEERIDAVLRGVIHSACDYLIKPVRMELLQNIWQHVVRKRQRKWKESEQQPRSMEDREQKQMRALEEGGKDSSGCEGSLNGNKRKKDGGEEKDEVPADPPQVKKPRVIWTPELHGKFLKALDELGIDKAVPKKILEIMNVSHITRDHVASHLQKYCANQKKNRRPEDRSNSTFMGDQEMAALAGVDRFNFQAPAASTPNLPQTLAAPQAGPSRTINSYMDMSAVDNIGLDVYVAFASTQRPASVQQYNIPFNYHTGVLDNTNLMQYEHPQPVVHPCRYMSMQLGAALGFACHLHK